MVQVQLFRPSRNIGSYGFSSTRTGRAAALTRSLVGRLIVDAAAEAYEAVGVSGGESLLWPGLFDAFALAGRLALATALTTDLVPLTSRRLGKLAGVLDALAVRLDGMPRSHDRIRGRTGAFAAMTARLPLLRAADIPFGFVFTLTRANLDELAWVARFASDEGAKVLQIRALDSEASTDQRLREIAADAAYLAAICRRPHNGNGMTVRLDLGHRDTLSSGLGRSWSGAPAEEPERRLADLVGALCIEADGVVVPLRHGFPRRYALGNLHCARLPVLVAHWRSGGGWARFRAHREASLRMNSADRTSLPPFNWFEAVSRRLGPRVALAID